MPATPTKKPRHYVFHLPRSALKIAAIAFGAGVLLFVLAWWSGRDSAFYKVEPLDPGTPQAQLEPLPAPLADGDAASDMPEPGEPSSERPQLVEAPPPAAPPAPVELPPPGSMAGESAGVALAPGAQPVPRPGSTPAPRYPADALRRGESGTVLVRVEVDTAGMPAGVALVQRSGSRSLDRAAMEAVRAWRFQPAQREGRAVPGSLVIPIEFTAE